MRKNVLVTSDAIGDRNLARLSRVATVYKSWEMEKESLDPVLPGIDVLIVFMWPPFLTAEALSRMKSLKFLQSILVGVNHVPFRSLGDGVAVASNAGAYSLEVSEHAMALLLAAEKKVVDHHVRVKDGARALGEFTSDYAKIGVLKGKTMGIVGYGSIGSGVGRLARAFGMKVLAFGRRGGPKDARLLSGSRGLDRLLKESDVVLLSLPLTRSTAKLIGERELSLMKDGAALVNIARGDLVDQKALYTHMSAHPDFKYATDAWWFKEGRETLETGFPLLSLPNFIGTPHTSGPTGVVSGRPGTLATDNVLRYIRGVRPRHVVDRSEYAGM